jgi:hypothetical protein
MIKIFSNYRRVYITRDGQTIEVTCGDEITTDEFATMVCEGDVECVHQITGDLIKFTANEATPAVVADTTLAPVAQTTPAEDAGLVPVPMAAGSKNIKA